MDDIVDSTFNCNSCTRAVSPKETAILLNHHDVTWASVCYKESNHLLLRQPRPLLRRPRSWSRQTASTYDMHMRCRCIGWRGEKGSEQRSASDNTWPIFQVVARTLNSELATRWDDDIEWWCASSFYCTVSNKILYTGALATKLLQHATPLYLMSLLLHNMTYAYYA